ncbi:MAG: hydroxysqualene dehydroxylase HpnE, partial [Pseudomonadota bacterium]|nr:hydroxysqualene dehydroxylase HpnE [Pseudomonadota bacterium]
PGGRARAVYYKDTILDNGQHLLSGAYTETLSLLSSLHSIPPLIRMPLRLNIDNHVNFRILNLPSPLHAASGMFLAKGLPFIGKLKAFNLIKNLRQSKYTSGKTVQEWLENQDRTINEQFFFPLCLALLNTPADQADATIFKRVLIDTLAGPHSATDLLFPTDDLTALFATPIIHTLRSLGNKVMVGTRIQSIKRHPEGFELFYGKSSIRAQHLILACDAPQSSRLLDTLGGHTNLSRQIQSIPHQPLITVYLQYPETVSLSQPMLGFTKKIVNWLFDHGRLRGKKGLIAAVTSNAIHSQQYSLPAIAKAISKELSQNLGLPLQPLWYKAIHEKQATFLAIPGLNRPEHKTHDPLLWLAGDYIAGPYPATIEAAVQSGLKCAECIRLKTGTPYATYS